MKIHAKKIVVVAAFAVVGSFMISRTAAAAAPITIQGVVYDDKNKPVAGVVVVAWCGGINFFGGSDTTDAGGHYLINTNGDDCPFDNELTVTTDINNDGLSDGAAHTQAHTSTYISIRLGKYTSVAVPEFGWVGAGAAVLGGIGAFSFVRRSGLRKDLGLN
jgi:hypothetical protein